MSWSSPGVFLKRQYIRVDFDPRLRLAMTSEGLLTILREVGSQHGRLVSSILQFIGRKGYVLLVAL